jgi:hypothetical protein
MIRSLNLPARKGLALSVHMLILGRRYREDAWNAISREWRSYVNSREWCSEEIHWEIPRSDFPMKVHNFSCDERVATRFFANQLDKSVTFFWCRRSISFSISPVPIGLCSLGIGQNWENTRCDGLNPDQSDLFVPAEFTLDSDVSGNRPETFARFVSVFYNVIPPSGRGVSESFWGIWSSVLWIDSNAIRMNTPYQERNLEFHSPSCIRICHTKS